MARIRIFSGAERYSDPWHPFAETSAAVDELLREAGHEVEVAPDVPESLAGLEGVDLLVVNSGGQPQSVIEPDEQWAAAFAGLAQWLADGGRLLGLHTASNTFPDWDEWSALLGGRWVRGTSHHPDRSIATFEPCPGAGEHPVWDGLESVSCYDERYSALEVFAGTTPLVQHELGEHFEVMGWALGERVVYDAMGHDGRSYASPERRRLLLNEVDWLLR